MRMIDPIAAKPIAAVQVYLTENDARYLKRCLDSLLEDSEAVNHFHVGIDSDLSFSIVTPTKLASAKYTELEKTVLEGICED
jgi:hypothetical protein